MKIAIIDSGINNEVFPDIKIKQVRFYGHAAIEETPTDYLGHGTAVVSCLYSKYPEAEYYSLCPGIDEEGNTDPIIEAYDIADAINYAVEKEVDFINISMGTTDFSNRKCVDDAMQLAFDKGIVVVVSAPNESFPSLPWGCKGALKVRESRGNGYTVTVREDDFGIKNFVVSCQLFRVTTREGKKIFAHGNSYAAVWLTSLLIEKSEECGSRNSNQLMQEIVEAEDKNAVEDVIQQKYDVVNEIPELKGVQYAGKKLILYSWTKEMHSIVRGTKHEGYEIVAAVDLFKKGNVGKDIGLLSHYTEYGVKVMANINEVDAKADVLVIGYLDQISKYDEKFTLEYILDYNLKNLGLQVFSFTPVEEKWSEAYQAAGLSIQTPFVFDVTNCNKILENVHAFIPVKKPVLGVFGTSSKQGKFTLQLAIREKLRERGVSCYHMSTEHQASILGADFTFADGYENNLIMKVGLERKLQVLNAIMVYIDNTSKDEMILVGGQSWVIPYNIKEQTFMRHAVFLEGVKPDRTIVVINPLLDDEEYVKDTIAAIKSIYKCITFAVAFSDYTPYMKNYKVAYKKLDGEQIQEISEKWRAILGVPCGCITDSAYIEELTDYIIEEFN